MKFSEARRYALSLPGAAEQPHFERASWRVNKKIFATVPPGGAHLNIFVDESEAKACVQDDPATYEEPWWGTKLAGVRVTLATANKKQVAELLAEAWRRRAPKRLIDE